MTFPALAIVTVTVSLMGGLLYVLGRIRRTFVEDLARHQASLHALEEAAK